MLVILQLGNVLAFRLVEDITRQQQQQQRFSFVNINTRLCICEKKYESGKKSKLRNEKGKKLKKIK